MMNQASNTETMAQLDSSLFENRHVVNANHGQASTYFPSTAGTEASTWTHYKVDNSSTENGISTNSTYQYDQSVQQPVSSSSSLGTVNATQEYSGYAAYNPNDPYGYGSTGYSSYYNGYQQQSNPSYTQPVGAHQGTGAPYPPLSSFQNSGSYAGSASYSSSTYYNPGDYQTAGSYPSSGYDNQTTQWSDPNYANYDPQQHSHYGSGTSAVYGSGTGTPTSVNYTQQYKQWADYYNPTEVTCAPGTESTSVSGASNYGGSASAITPGYQPSNSQPPPPPLPPPPPAPLPVPPPPPPPPPHVPSWMPEASSSEFATVQV